MGGGRERWICVGELEGWETGWGKTACSPVAPGEEAAAAPYPGTWTTSDSGTSVTQHTRLVTHLVTHIPM